MHRPSHLRLPLSSCDEEEGVDLHQTVQARKDGELGAEKRRHDQRRRRDVVCQDDVRARRQRVGDTPYPQRVDDDVHEENLHKHLRRGFAARVKWCAVRGVNINAAPGSSTRQASRLASSNSRPPDRR